MKADRELAVIAKVQKVEPIEGYDRVELLTVENYTVIGGKGEYKPGDLCVYVFYDTVLPVKEEFEFLRKRCYSPKYDGFRIKEMKMCGVFSSGIVFPTSILPSGSKITEGQEVSEVLGIRKYDPEALAEERLINHNKKKFPWIIQKLLRYKWVQRLVFGKHVAKVPYPDTVSKSNEVNIQKVFNQLKSSGHKFIVTEKMEGCSSCYCLVPRKKGKKSDYRLYSHNAMRFDGDGSYWDQISQQYELERVLRALYKRDGINYAIEGEICMEGVQKNIYNFSEPQFFVFRIFNVDTGRVLPQHEMWEICSSYFLPHVPILDTDFIIPDTLEELLDYSDGESVFGNVKREGVILTSENDPHLRAKVKSIAYKEWWAKKDETV